MSHVGSDGDFHNKVSVMIAELPVGLADPVKRLAVISDQMADLKASKEAVAAEALMSLTGFAPPMLLAVGTRMATRLPQRNVNTVTTNVPGPQTPRFLAGRRMLQCYPYVPLAGQIRVAVAIFSYLNQVSFGVTGDYDAAPDIGILCDGINDGMSELLKLSVPPAPATSRGSGSRHRGRRSPASSTPRSAGRKDSDPGPVPFMAPVVPFNIERRDPGGEAASTWCAPSRGLCLSRHRDIPCPPCGRAAELIQLGV